MVLLQLRIAQGSNVNEVKPGIKQTNKLLNLDAVKRHNSFTLPTLEGYLPTYIAADIIGWKPIDGADKGAQEIGAQSSAALQLLLQNCSIE